MGNSDSKEDNIERADFGDFTWITSWLLNQIKSPYNSKEIVDFKYSKYQFNDRNNDYANQNYNILVYDTPAILTGSHDTPIDVAPKYVKFKGASFYKEMCYLVKIKGMKEYIQFIRTSSSDPKLQKVEIYDLNDNLIKVITFNYFEKRDAAAKISHNLLSSLSIKGNNSSEEQIYTFDYYISNHSFISDQWGYYKKVNSIDTYQDLFIHKEFAKDRINRDKNMHSQTSLDLVYDYELFDRSTIVDVPSYFSLKKIIFPTGGYTEYIYESNEVKENDFPFRKKRVGGQRIKKIISKQDNGDIAKVTEYKYGENENGVGYCDINLNHHFFADEISDYHTDFPDLGEFTTVQPLRYYSTSPLLSELNDLPVVYKEVARYEYDPNNEEQNGKVILKYNYTPKYKLGSFIQRANGLPNGLANYRGLYYIEKYHFNNKPILHSKDIIKNNGDTIMSEIFIYINTDSISLTGLKVNRKTSSRCAKINNTGLPLIYKYVGAKYEYAYYTIIANTQLLKSKKKISYLGTNKIIENELYTYNQNNILKTTQKNVDNRDIYSENFVYPTDVFSDKVFRTMRLNNMLSTLIEKESFLNHKAIGATKTFYRATNDSQIVPDFVEISSTDLINAYKVLTYDKYNEMGKILQYTTIEGYPIVVLWYYNSQYPIVRIQNATYEQVCNALGGESEVDRISRSLVLSDSDIAKVNQLRLNPNLSNAMIASYTYKPLVGITTSIDPNGLTTYYKYDNLNRLKEIYLFDNGVKKILETYDYNYRK